MITSTERTRDVLKNDVLENSLSYNSAATAPCHALTYIHHLNVFDTAYHLVSIGDDI